MVIKAIYEPFLAVPVKYHLRADFGDSDSHDEAHNLARPKESYSAEVDGVCRWTTKPSYSRYWGHTTLSLDATEFLEEMDLVPTKIGYAVRAFDQEDPEGKSCLFVYLTVTPSQQERILRWRSLVSERSEMLDGWRPPQCGGDLLNAITDSEDTRGSLTRYISQTAGFYNLKAALELEAAYLIGQKILDTHFVAELWLQRTEESVQGLKKCTEWPCEELYEITTFSLI